MENKTVELVNRWHEYEQSNDSATIADFCRHYLAVNDQKNKAIKTEDFMQDLPIGTKLSRAVGRLYKFHASYARKSLAELNFKNLDDFLYLTSLNRMKSPKKSELIYENISEFSSGTEIIKRLIKLGLAKEFNDSEDKRSKRIKITPKGEKTLLNCYKKMMEVNALVYSTVSESDKELAYSILKPLDNFHTEFYDKTKNKTMSEIKQLIPELKV